jgi:F-type H+-transporting ATPase subunit epsilon
MKNSLNLEIITPNGLIFSGKVKDVLLPGEEGEFGILPEHVSLFTLLSGGVIEFTKDDGKVDAVVISSGNVTLADGGVIALVEGAIPLDSDSDIAHSLDSIKELLKDVADSHHILASVEAKLS